MQLLKKVSLNSALNKHNYLPVPNLDLTQKQNMNLDWFLRQLQQRDYFSYLRIQIGEYYYYCWHIVAQITV